MPQGLCAHFVYPQPFASFRSTFGTMDAATTAAVLAIVADESRDAAIRDLLLERERLAMAVADRDSYLAQRHFAGGSAQVARPGPLMTYQTAFRQRHNDYLDAHAAMRAAARALRNGDSDGALNILEHEVGDEDSEASSMDVSEADATDAMEENEEEEEAEEDAEVEPS